MGIIVGIMAVVNIFFLGGRVQKEIDAKKKAEVRTEIIIRPSAVMTVQEKVDRNVKFHLGEVQR